MAMKKTLNKKATGIILSYVYFVLNAVLSIVISSFVIHIVGKTDNGIYQSMTAFITYLVLLEFGMSTLMSRNISLLKKDGTDTDEINKNISTIWITTIILSIVMVFLLITFYLLIPAIYSNSFTGEQITLSKKIFVFAGANLVFTFLTSTLNGLILAYEKYTYEKFLNLIRLLVRTSLILILLTINSNILILPIIDCGLGIVTFIITLFYCLFKFKVKISFKYYDKKIIRSCLPLALSMLIQGLVNTTNTVVDKFLISIMMTPEDVSVYSITMLIFNMVSSIGTLPNTLFIPSIAKNVRNKISGHDLTKSLIEPCRLNVIIFGLVIFGYFLVGKQFIILIYGSDFEKAWLCSLIILVPLFFYLTDAIMAHVLTLYNKRQAMAYISFISTIINIVSTIFAIKLIGMIGAALCTSLSIIIQVIALNIYYKKKIGISVLFLYKKAFQGTIPCLILSFAFSFPIQHRMPSTLSKFLVGGFLFVTMFIILFTLFGANIEEKNRIKTVINTFVKRDRV